MAKISVKQITGVLPIINGGTGQTTSAGAFNAISPLTTIGDTLYNDGTNDVRLAGNFTSTIKYLSQTGDGVLSAAPSWQTIPSAGLATYFFIDTASDIGGYFNQQVTASVGVLQDQTFTGLTAGATTTLTNFATLPGFPNITFLPSGVTTFYLTARQTSGTRTVQLFGELYKRASGGAETLLSTTALTIPLTGVNAAYIFQGAIPTGITLLGTDRIVSRIRAVVSAGGGPSVDVVISMEDATAARMELPSATVDATNFVPYSGALFNVDLNGKTLSNVSKVTVTNSAVGVVELIDIQNNQAGADGNGSKITMSAKDNAAVMTKLGHIYTALTTTGGFHRGDMTFGTTPLNASGPTDRMRLNHLGYLGVSSGSAINFDPASNLDVRAIGSSIVTASISADTAGTAGQASLTINSNSSQLALTAFSSSYTVVPNLAGKAVMGGGITSDSMIIGASKIEFNVGSYAPAGLEATINSFGLGVGTVPTTNTRVLSIAQDSAFASFGSGVSNPTYFALYANQATPTASNYILLANSATTYVNAPTTLILAVSDSSKIVITSTLIAIGNQVTDAVVINPKALSGGGVIPFTYTAPASTLGAAGAENIGVNWDMSATRQFASNTAITTQRAFVIKAPTYSFQTATGTITNAATLSIEGSPIVGTNAAITNPLSLWIQGGISRFDGDVKLGVAGNGIYIKEGTNATSGLATLIDGTLVVSTTKVTANSRIYLTGQGGTITNLGFYSVTARTGGTSFTISSSNILDTNTVAWLIIEPA